MTRSVLLTCPPMLGLLDELRPEMEARGWTLRTPPVVQTLSEDELLEIVPEVEGWIIGDDPATAEVLGAGVEGRLRAAVKWGVGVDNVDRRAVESLGLPFSNTPAMFGDEVADIAVAYIVALARETFAIDRGVRGGEWPKPRGTSLAERTAVLVGFGSVGREIARRLLAAKMRVLAHDPAFTPVAGLEAVEPAAWPEAADRADVLVLCCSLNDGNRHLIDAEVLARVPPGLLLVNVSRGGLVDEAALVDALARGTVRGAALDVFETEPLPPSSPLRARDGVIFGSHNASNTREAVLRASRRAIELLDGFLEEEAP